MRKFGTLRAMKVWRHGGRSAMTGSGSVAGLGAAVRGGADITLLALGAAVESGEGSGDVHRASSSLDATARAIIRTRYGLNQCHQISQ
ncbi:hypothetical protein FFA01_30110 [Frigoribacterium faeni]|uniref:Uncharacterized protein n=1 Tax=Frigoribacterium faeni TaxID=145483 RepID=A0ABQ0UTB8_9MICO|nr:hypothetical protein GCM10025699_55270 [Microbacterium flavescens]GEK84702.1 hypothetical protein FFA01_30110 [Frigoribacterium faeni]